MTTFNHIIQSVYIRGLILEYVGELNLLDNLIGKKLSKVIKYNPTCKWLERWGHVIPDINQINMVHLVDYCYRYNSKLDTFKYLWNAYRKNINDTNDKENLDKMISNILSKGKLDIYKYMVEEESLQCIPFHIELAVRSKRVDIIQYIEKNAVTGGKECTTKALDNAAFYGNLEVVTYLSEHRTEGCTKKAINNAVENAHFNIIKYLTENRTEGCTKEALDYAAHNGDFEIVKYLSENRTEGCTTDAIDLAASNRYNNIVIYLCENRTEGCTKEALNWAARKGNLDLVKYLSQNRTEGCTTDAMDDAAKNGFLDVVVYLSENRTEGCTTNAMDWAIMYDKLEVVKYLKENRTEGYTEYSILFAKGMNHKEIIEYLDPDDNIKPKERKGYYY